MIRVRDLSRWPVQHQHVSPDAFLQSPVGNGVHSIHIGTEWLDMLVQDQGSPVTLVSFHAALSPRAATVPSLQGQGLATDTGVNLIAIADPTIALGDIDLAWFLGNRKVGRLPPLLSPLIQHAADNLSSRRLILFGASGGGYAAIRFGEFFPDSLVLAVNPRLNLAARPKADIDQYLTVGHGAVGATPRSRVRKEFVVDDLSNLYTSLPFDLCIFQNLGDAVFLTAHLLPFLSQVAGDPRLFTRVEWTGEGHTPIPAGTIRSIVSALAEVPDQRQAILGAGFSPAS